MTTSLVVFCGLLLAQIYLLFTENYTMLAKVVHGMTVVCMISILVIVYALSIFT